MAEEALEEEVSEEAREGSAVVVVGTLEEEEVVAGVGAVEVLASRAARKQS